MEKLFQQIAANFEHIDKTNTNVSQSTIGWQLHHSLLVIHSISNALQKSNPEDYVRKFNKWRTIVFLIKKIPRGKAKAPSRVVPLSTANVEDLQELLLKARQALDATSNLSKNAFFEHPFFGKLNLAQTKKFLAIHTNHHLKIVKDILVK